MSGTALCLDALDGRYSQAAQRNEQWVVIREARAGAGFDGNRRQCDYLAINTHKGRGLQLIGHEVKVSMADWKRELADIEKAELFAQHCRRWWIVAPSALATRIKHEVPPSWGLLSVSDAGRITELTAAPAREPKEVPAWWWIGWLAQLDRRDKRSQRAALDRLVTERVEEEVESRKRRWEGQRDHRSERLERVAALIEKLNEETGIDLHHSWDHDLERLGRLWRITRARRMDFDSLAKHMRESADALDDLMDAAESRDDPAAPT